MKILFFNFNPKKRNGKIFDWPIDVKLSEMNLVQPDILYISRERFSIVTETCIDGAPDLIVEVLSSSTAYYDLIEKKDNYARFGVKNIGLSIPKSNGWKYI